MSNQEYPQSCICPLTMQVMVDPVVDREGNSYERNAIERWLSTNPISPVTRTPLRLQDLTENRALRQLIRDIQEGRRAVPAPAVPVTSSIPQMSGVSLGETENINFYVNSCNLEASEYLYQFTAIPPEGQSRTPSDICCVVDISGSMGGEATLATATGAKESHGLSLLDIVKHAVRTVIHSLNEFDRLSVVAYSTTARVVFPLIVMDGPGKEQADRLVATLNPEDTTNIWDGLNQGIEQLKNGASMGRMSAILLLTDGLPNVEPPRGTLQMLKRYKETNGLPCAVIGTFGFGYSLDSALLEGLAKEGNGMYAFIPDASFVGTAFVNAVSNLLTTVAKDVHIVIEPLVAGVQIDVSEAGFPCTENAGKWDINAGTIHYGQQKTSVIRVKGPPGSSNLVRATLKFEGKDGIRELSASPSSSGDQTNVIKMNRLRQLFVTTVLQSIGQMKGADVDNAQNGIKSLIRTIRESGPAIVNTEWTQGLLQDLEGQVTAAFSRKDWFQKWGVHYLPSLARAHLLQQCNNFKDPGVQLYGGKLFRRLRDEADDIFCRLPPPTPSIAPSRPSASSAAPAQRPIQSMAVYNNADNPCFSGNSQVTMLDGSKKAIADLAKGDRVLSGSGKAATVACVVETFCAGGRARMVRVCSGLEVTPWHPIQGSDGVWRFPCEVGAVEEVPCDAVYSLVLESDCVTALEGADHFSAGGVVIGGVTCATLGHGMRDESRLVEADGWTGHTTVLWHDYFASSDVIRHLSVLPGFAHGRVQFMAGCMGRDAATGLLTSFRAGAAVAPQTLRVL